MDGKSALGTEEEEQSCPSTPLRSLSMTADTLSVRQTRIDDRHTYPNTLDMLQEYNKSIGSSSAATSHRDVNELVQYPPDIISTTVERAKLSNWGYQSRPAIVSNAHHIHANSVRHKNNGKTKLKRLSSNESVVSNHVNDSRELDAQSVVSESGHSGIDSPVSVVSNATGINYFAINNLIADMKSISTQSASVEMINEYVQVNINDDSSGPLFELRRSNANMKGQLEQLDYIVEEMVKERSTLQMRLHSLEKELKFKSDQIEEICAQRDRLVGECEELKLGISKWESIVSEYQDVVGAKSLEIQANNEDLKQMSIENEKIKVICEHLKIDLESKDNEIKELNKKFDHLSHEFESLIKSKVNLEVELKRVKSDSEAVMHQKEWFESELNKLQIKLNESQMKLVSERELTINTQNEYQKSQALNALLKQQIIDTKNKAVKEKETLMRHLEGIEVDLALKETENQLLSNKHGETIIIEKQENLSKDLNDRLVENDRQLESLKKECKHLNELNEKLNREQEISINDLNSVKRNLNDRDQELNLLKSYNSDLELKIRGINVDLRRQKELSDMLRKDKKDSETKLTSLTYDNKTLANETRQSKETIEKHERSLKQLQSNLIAKETKLELIEKEKYKLNGTLVILEQEMKQLRENAQQIKVNDSNSDINIYELQIQKSELENVISALSTEMRSNQIKYEEERNKLSKLCSELQSKLNENNDAFQVKLNDEIAKNNELLNELDSYKNDNNQMKALLESYNKNNIELKYSENVENNNNILHIKDEKIRCLESNVKLLMKKYKEALQTKKEVEFKNENLAEVQLKVSQNYASTQTDNDKSDEQCNSIQEIERLQEIIRTKNSIIDENQQIILKLEHEKGRLLSAGDNSANQHIVSLELLVASKSEEVTELNERLRRSKETVKELELKLSKKISEMENELKKERALTKDLRYSIFSEKRENNYHKKDLNEMKKALSTSNSIADKRKQEVLDIESDMKKQKDTEISLRSELEKLNNDLTNAKEENYRLKSKINESLDKKEPLLEQLRNLSLSLKEKNQEIECINLQNSSYKEIYETEIQGLKQQISSHKNNIEMLNNELNELRKEKFNIQSSLVELKVSFKNIQEENKKLRELLKSCKIEFKYVNELLDRKYEASKSKPLVNLHACVESLKQEMELLQEQLDDHN